MPTITLTITDAESMMIDWAAARRNMTRNALIADAMAAYLTPLAANFNTSYTENAMKLFEQLPPDKQVEFLGLLEAAVPK